MNAPAVRAKAAQGKCSRCDSPATHGRLCDACLADELASHDMDDDEFDPEGPAFECAGYNDGSGFYCPMWGTEECDWECPEGGMG